jgi:Na+-translocating ferredoxin:NAD+ oxidoreductase RnfD subunit
MKPGRFFRTPKGTLVLVLAALVTVALAKVNARTILVACAAAVIPACAIDLVVLRARLERWVFPDGALLTALIVAMVMSPFERWWVVGITAAIAVASKYIFRARRANVFNPAAFARVATFYVFHTGQSWWGALPDLGVAGLALLCASGAFVAQRVNKLPAVVAFLGVYFTCCTIAAYAGNPAHVAELFREPDLQASLYFAFFMVSDPPTSPARSRHQIVFGAITALAAYATFALIGAAYFLLAGVLVANVWEALRRTRAHAIRVQLQHDHHQQQ